MDENFIDDIIKVEEQPIEIIDYRGFKVPIYADDYGQCFYCIWEGEEISFGTYNFNYQYDVEYLINEKLDLIYRFDSPYFGASLHYSNFEHTDIKLSYRLKTLKTWKNCKLTKEELIEKSKEILMKKVNK